MCERVSASVDAVSSFDDLVLRWSVGQVIVYL